MAASVTEELLRQCEREPTSGSLLPLLDHAIEIKLPLKSVEYYTRIAMVIKSFFMCCADPQERAYVLETVLVLVRAARRAIFHWGKSGFSFSRSVGGSLQAVHPGFSHMPH
jgi:hypothetical protein